jgi:hypothetical protein
MRPAVLIPSLATILALAACGGGHGGGAAAAPPSSNQLGERAVPGYTLRVARLAGAAGDAITARVQVIAAIGQPPPATVSCWIGSAYDPSASPTTANAVVGATDRFDAVLTMPQPPPAGAAVWVRLTFPDGSVLEAGADAFPL